MLPVRVQLSADFALPELGLGRNLLLRLALKALLVVYRVHVAAVRANPRLSDHLFADVAELAVVLVGGVHLAAGEALPELAALLPERVALLALDRDHVVGGAAADAEPLLFLVARVARHAAALALLLCNPLAP